jgi:type II restriction enzyme
MKYLDCYQSRIGCGNAEQVFEYLIKNKKETIRSWDFFVDWAKINSRIEKIEPALNLWNVLIGSENTKQKFITLASQYPEIIVLIPVLIAVRDKSIKVLAPIENNVFNYKEYSFKIKNEYSESELIDIAEFLEKCGLLYMLENKKLKSIVDYVTGVEVGLDSNARKNRSGTSMETITELMIKRICDLHGYRYLAQATSSKIEKAFNITVAVDKASRSYDFAVLADTKLFLIETNYYGGGGSKLKSVAGEFTTLYHLIRNETPEHGFIWITDGKGWGTAKKPLKEAFDATDCIMNLEMLDKGILEDILEQGLL